MIRTILFIFLLIFVCTSQAQSMKTKHLWIDTDLAIDDWLALAYLIEQPNLHIDFITVENDGVNDCAHGLPQLRYFLSLSHHENISTACENLSPSYGHQQFLLAWRHDAEHFFGASCPTKNKFENCSIVSFIQTQLNARPNSVTLVALAPLTSVAAAYEAAPKLLTHKIEKIYFTGGNLGDVSLSIYDRAASWNIFVDPLAFSNLFHYLKPQQLYLVPMRITSPLLPTANEIYQKLTPLKSSFSPTTALIYQMLLRNQKESLPDDAITAVLVNQPELCQTKTFPIHAYVGKTDSDRDLTISPAGTPTIFCMKLSADQFVTNYIKGIIS